MPLKNRDKHKKTPRSFFSYFTRIFIALLHVFVHKLFFFYLVVAGPGCVHLGLGFGFDCGGYIVTDGFEWNSWGNEYFFLFCT